MATRDKMFGGVKKYCLNNVWGGLRQKLRLTQKLHQHCETCNFRPQIKLTYTPESKLYYFGPVQTVRKIACIQVRWAHKEGAGGALAPPEN